MHVVGLRHARWWGVLVVGVIVSAPMVVGSAAVAASVPGAPTGVGAVAKDASAVVSWRAPASTGGSAITGYVVTVVQTGRVVQVGATARSATIGALTNGTGYSFKVAAKNSVGVGPSSAATAVVKPRVTMSIGSVSVWEGTGFAVSASFAITLREAARVPVSASYSTAAGTATAGFDFTSVSGTVSFAVGQTTKLVTVNVAGDAAIEPTETFTVKLSAPVNAIIGTGIGTGTIRDDDSTSGPNVAVSDATVNEGDSGLRSVQLEIRTASSTFPVDVNYSVVRGSAEDADFVTPTTPAHTIQLTSANTIETFVVKPDLLKEGNERFGIFVWSTSLPALDARGVVTIVDNDLVSPPTSPLFAPPTSGNLWTPPTPLPAGTPGDVIWSKATSGPANATTRTMLYRSRSTLGSDIAVSGWVIVPTGTPPAGGWPIVVWNHPTRGMDDSCAPTHGNVETSSVYIDAVLGRGYMVVASDYEGLGTPGPVPYLAAESYAHVVLDSIRAARKITANASNRAVLYGWSEGGIASTAALELWPYYAPELDIRGAVGVAAGDTLSHTDLFSGLARNSTWRGLVLQGVAGLNNAYPSAGFPSYFLTPNGVSALPGAQGTPCYPSPPPTSDFQSWLLTDPPSPPAMSAAMGIAEERGWITARPPAAPLLLVHGLSDTLVPPELVPPVVRRLCDMGGDVDLRWYAGDHFTVPSAAQSDVLAWISDRLAGTPAANACDNTPPTIVSITRNGVSPTNASTVSWDVTFSEPVEGVTAANFTIATTLTATALTNVSGSGTTWTVTVDSGIGDGDLRLDLSDPTGITDAELNPLSTTLTGETYAIDRTAPNVLSIARADPNPTSATSVSWTVTFDEPVSGVDLPNFALSGDAAGSSSITSVTGTGTTWTLTATVGSTGTLGADLVAGSGIIDAAGNNLANTITGETYNIQ